MRIDASQILAQGGLKIKSGTNTVLDSLKEGDVIRATVLSGEKNGTLNLKTQDGQIFSAKLDTDIKLTKGDTVLLEVLGKEENQISLSFSGVESAGEDLSPREASLVRDFSDKSLAPFAAKLAEQSIPVTEETARVMRDIMAQNPGLSIEEAAFLASNKLTGDENLMKAALALLSGGEKTDAMIANLIAALGEQDFLVNQDLGTRNPENSISGGTLPNSFGTAASESPLTEFIARIAVSLSSLPEHVTGTQNEAGRAPSEDAQAIISQHDGNMQSNISDTEDILFKLSNTAENAEQSATQAAQDNTSQTVAGEGAANPGEAAAPGEQVKTTPQDAMREIAEKPGETAAMSGEIAENTQPGETEQAGQSGGRAQTAAPPSLGETVAQMLSEMPEFKGTPPAALERFSNMLLRVAKDAGDGADNADNNGNTVKDTKMLAAQLEKMFAAINKDDADAGIRLRAAREEMSARLSLVEEEISKATGPRGAELLSQTQKLMDHVRLLNNIEQFTYMQLPVKLREEQKTAELYVFKRKGGKRADPDNVNILMSIDLENMGHWEALLNIKGKDVYLNMEVAGEAEKEHFSSNTVLLHEMLSQEGFKLINTNIKISQEETTPLNALSAFERYTGGKQGRIDLKI